MRFYGISVDALTELIQKISFVRDLLYQLSKNWLQLVLQYKNVSHINGSKAPHNSFGFTSRMMVQK